MATIQNNEIWVEFFQCYKSMPELWKVKCELFKDRNKKKNAWAKLLEIYKKIDNNANIDSLKKRVSNIRSCYRRELKKLEDSPRSGTGEDDVYVPMLWFFDDDLEFLRDHETQIRGVSTVDLDQEIEEGEEAVESSCVNTNSMKRKKNSVQQMTAERNELLKEALGHLTSRQEKDDASIFAESWVASFRKLSSMQQIFAKKAIEDVLVLGQLGLLNFNTVNSSTPTSTSSTPPSSSTSRASTPISTTSNPQTVLLKFNTVGSPSGTSQPSFICTPPGTSQPSSSICTPTSITPRTLQNSIYYHSAHPYIPVETSVFDSEVIDYSEQ